MSLDLQAPLQGLPLDELVRRASAPPLAAETERSLARDAATGDESAREQLVAAHLRDVLDEAIAHRGGGVSVDSLVRRGLDGLVHAAAEYDPAKHAPFATYARRNIRRAMRAHLFPH